MNRTRVMMMLAVLALPAGVWASFRPLLARPRAPHRAPPRPGAHEQVRALAYDRSGRLLSVGSEGWLKLWNGQDGRPTGMWRLAPPDRRILAAAFSADGTRLAVARLDNVFEVWDVGHRARLRRFRL